MLTQNFIKMDTPALILVTIVWSVVTFVTGFFFYKVLTMPQKSEPDSFEDNGQQ
jgi:hypothetical protein